MAPALPRVALALSAVCAVLTLASLRGSTTWLALVPGNTVLGKVYVFNVLTCFFAETSVVRLVLGCAALCALGAHSVERAHGAKRTAAVVLLGATVAGLAASFAGLMRYMASGDEEALYRPQSGMSGLVGGFAVLAWQGSGEAPLVLGVPPAWLPTSVAPTLVVAGAVGMQLLLGAGSDAVLCVLCTVLTWVQLRFILPVSAGGGPGDSRPDFEFLHALPQPLRAPLRPLEKLGSALCLPLASRLSALLPLYAALDVAEGVVGGSFAALPAPGGVGGAAGGAGTLNPYASPHAARDGSRTTIDLHVHLHGGRLGTPSTSATSILVSDPIAERRRERALKSLDKRLAELKNKMRGTGAVPLASGGVMPSP